jgi:hypothetical protein
MCRAIAQAENLFPYVTDPEFAVGLDQCCAYQEERAHAVMNDVGLQDCLTVTEEGCIEKFAAGKLR